MTAKLIPALALSALGLFAAAGCSDKPHEYGRQRPPVDELYDKDRGLQSKDVVAASDLMAQRLLTIPEVTSSPAQLLLVVDRVDNQTQDRTFNADIFLERLRVNLSRYGRGKIALIENRAKLQDLQSRELDPGVRPDDFGQGPGRPAQPNGIQPDFALYAKFMEMPNRATSYYFCQFTVTNLRTRQQIWTDAFEVKALR